MQRQIRLPNGRLQTRAGVRKCNIHVEADLATSVSEGDTLKSKTILTLNLTDTEMGSPDREQCHGAPLTCVDMFSSKFYTPLMKKKVIIKLQVKM